jgi:hypothetical protein
LLDPEVPRASIRYSAGNGKAESLTEGSPESDRRERAGSGALSVWLRKNAEIWAVETSKVLMS